MKEETRYFESMKEIGDFLNIKYISVLAKILNAKSCNVGIGDDYVKLTFVTSSVIRHIPEFFDTCTEFVIYAKDSDLVIDLYYYVKD
jgi:hypothetical protein